MNHVLDDRFNSTHFLNWLDGQIQTTDEWEVIYAAIFDLLSDQPELIKDHSWSEIRRLAGV